MNEKRPLRANGQLIPDAIVNGPAGDFARYCGETDPAVLALLDAEDQREALVFKGAFALADTTRLPEWMQRAALGRDMRPVAALVVDAVLDTLRSERVDDWEPDTPRMKVLPPLTDEELYDLLYAIQMQIDQTESNLRLAQSEAIRGALARRWAKYNSLRTAIAETRANP